MVAPSAADVAPSGDGSAPWGGRIEVSDVTGLVGLEKLRDEWTAVWEHCPRATPFQHPDWLVPYCRPFVVQDP